MAAPSFTQSAVPTQKLERVTAAWAQYAILSSMATTVAVPAENVFQQLHSRIDAQRSARG